jgi:DNA-binding NarL/FixJ family response regulator
MSEEQPAYRSLLVIDDHNMVIHGIKLLIGDRFTEFYAANNGAAGIALAIQYQPRLVIIDLILRDIPGDAVTREIKYKCPASRILAYSFNASALSVLKMFEAGVHGYVVKSEDDTEFKKAVTYLLEGKDYYCKEARQHIINKISFGDEQLRLIIANTGFSAKEIEIIRLICRQHTAKEISREVNLTERTVEQYRSNITKRIGARNVAGIIRYALQKGIIELDDLG